jgi:predicted AAA+ superfamily ATPase
MLRNATADLLRWKNSPDRKPLMVYGQRQVGKSWLVKDFGAQNYENMVVVEFDNDPLARVIFDADFDTARIIRDIETLKKQKIVPGDTLIILDEIQTCPLAVTALKYFNEHANEYHIVAAGSLLGVMTLQGTGFPVGKVDKLTVYPMTFMEFLQAVDGDRFVNHIKNQDWNALKIFGDTIENLLKQYFIVGGMPAAVKKYAETGNFMDAKAVQKLLVNDYYVDFAKHVPARNLMGVRSIWDSAPAQLGKENKRFLYSEMKKGSKGREYSDALRWLLDARMVYKLTRISRPDIPLKLYAEPEIFKLYVPDIGLLSYLTNLDPETYLAQNNALFAHYKGILAEQFVFQELIANYEDMPVYYWANGRNTAEIEFVVQNYNNVIPIEVKAGKNIKSQSLRTYVTAPTFAPQIAIRTSLANYRETANIYDTDCVLYEIPLWAIGNGQIKNLKK